MPKLAANLSMLFPELDFLERFSAARAAGFRYVEYQFPYAYGAEQLAERARDAGVQVVLHNLPAGDTASRGLLGSSGGDSRTGATAGSGSGCGGGGSSRRPAKR